MCLFNVFQLFDPNIFFPTLAINQIEVNTRQNIELFGLIVLAGMIGNKMIVSTNPTDPFLCRP